MEKAATTFWRTLTNFKCGKWRFWPDIPRTLPLPTPSCSCFALATVAPSGTLLVDQPACWLADWLTYCCHNSSAQCWRSRRSFNYQAAGGVRGLHKESGELKGGDCTGSCSANGAAFQLRCEAWPAARLSSRSSCKARHEESYCHSRKVKRPLDNNNNSVW